MIEIIKKVKRGKEETYVTSSFFSDLKEIRKDMPDVVKGLKTYRTDSVKNKNPIAVNKVAISYSVMQMLLWKKGCEELSNYIASLSEAEVSRFKGAIYYGKDYDMTDTSLSEIMKNEYTEGLRPKLLRTR